jgi:hypothetical protein
MPTDPFVAADTKTAPRNEPTLAPGVVLPPSRAWRTDRPGDLPGGVQPTGALFGSPGPNVGYALRLVHRASGEFRLAPGEHLEDAEAVDAAVAMKRAASFGRAPVATDVERAVTLLGYDGGADTETAARRADAVAGAHHDYARCRAVADQVDLEVLRA